MKDLRHKLEPIWRAATRLTPSEGGRCVMFMSACEGEGTSSVAASFALIAAGKARKSAWLIDLDFRRNEAYSAFAKGFGKGVGKPGRAYDASLRTDPIYSLVPSVVDEHQRAAERRLLGVHEIKNSRLLVTRFRHEALRKGQKVQLRTRPQWWKRVRSATDWVVVDAPSLSRSQAGLAMASQMDGVFLVLEADSTGAADVIGLRDEIEAHGGRVAGVVMNRIGADARFADRLAG